MISKRLVSRFGNATFDPSSILCKFQAAGQTIINAHNTKHISKSVCCWVQLWLVIGLWLSGTLEHKLVGICFLPLFEPLPRKCPNWTIQLKTAVIPVKDSNWNETNCCLPFTTEDNLQLRGKKETWKTDRATLTCQGLLPNELCPWQKITYQTSFRMLIWMFDRQRIYHKIEA